MFLTALVIAGKAFLPCLLWWSVGSLWVVFRGLLWPGCRDVVITVIFHCLGICAGIDVCIDNGSRPGHIGQGCSLESALRPFATIGTKCPGLVCGI